MIFPFECPTVEKTGGKEPDILFKEVRETMNVIENGKLHNYDGTETEL